MVVLRVAAFVGGLVVVALTFSSAVRTVVVPRAVTAALPRAVLVVVGAVIEPFARSRSSWSGRDRVRAYHAPYALVLLAIAWILLVTIGFAPMYWAVGADGWRAAFRISGSPVTTLGFGTTGTDGPGTALEVIEAVVGLILVALLISFLPTMYSVFSSRERMVSFMAVRGRHAAVGGRAPGPHAPHRRRRRAARDLGSLGGLVRRGPVRARRRRVGRRRRPGAGAGRLRGWRVNYDAPLLALCAPVSAPYAPWSSDRSLRSAGRALR